MNRRERFLRDNKQRTVIDTDVFPGVGHHLDYSIFDERGNLITHVTFKPDISPQEISDFFARVADNFEKRPLNGMSPESMAKIIKIFREEAAKVPGLKPEEK